MRKSIFNSLFSSRKSKIFAKTQGINRKVLQFEALEERQLLSVSAVEYDMICQQYSGFTLPDLMTDVNIIELTELTDQAFHGAIDLAGTTASDDLVIVRTDKIQNTIDLNAPLIIDFDTDQTGSLTIASLGDVNLNLRNTNEVMTIENGLVFLGGITFVGAIGTDSEINPKDLLKVSDDAITGMLDVSFVTENNYDSVVAIEGLESNGTICDFYTVETYLGNSEWVYLTGIAPDSDLDSTLYKYTTSTYSDADKIDPYSGGVDCNMCWAGAASNMLAYSGWGTSSYSDCDDIFSLYRQYFKNDGFNTNNAIKWFFTGSSSLSDKTILKNQYLSSGGYHTQSEYNTAYSETSGVRKVSISDMGTMVQHLRNNDAVGISVGAYTTYTGNNREGGHAMSVYGYGYNTDYTSSSSSYYTKLFVADSNDQTDQLKSYVITWNSSVGTYNFPHEDVEYGGNTGRIDEFQFLEVKPSATAPDLNVINGGTLSSYSITAGTPINITTGHIENIGTAIANSGYTIKVYASTNTTITSVDTFLGFYTANNSLRSGYYTSLTMDNVSTDGLSPGTYYIGWIISDVDGEIITSNNTGYCLSLLTVTNSQSATTIPVTIDSTDASVNLTSNGFTGNTSYLFDASSSPDWITGFVFNLGGNVLTLGKGKTTLSFPSGSCYMTVNATENTTGSSRTWTMTVTQNGSDFAYIKFTQPARSSSFTDDYYEPNDTYSTAYNLGTVSSTRTISNLKIIPDNLEDWFKFTLSSAGTSDSSISINYTHGNEVDLDMKLYNASSSTTSIDSSTGTSGTETISLNDLAAGTYYIYIYQYSGSSLSDSAAYSLTINPGTPVQTFPDLSTSNGGTLSAFGVTKGDSFTLSDVSISNIGTAASGSYTIKYYASTNSTISTSDTLLGTYTMSSLGAGSSTTDSRSFSTSFLTAGSSYYIGWIITGTGESDTANNTGRTYDTVTVNAVQTFPDLSTSNGGTLSAVGVTKGNSFTLSDVSISNVGTAASGSYTIQYYASTDSTVNTSDTLLGTYTMSSLSAGSSTTDSRSFSTSFLTAGSSYYIGWIITGTGESDTANNTGRTYDTVIVIGGTNKLQLVYSDQTNRSVQAGSVISLPVMYKTMDGEANLTGLGLRIHYNSNFLTYTGNSDLFTEGAVSQIVQDAADTNNNDNDSSTDRVLIMAWSNASGNWPGVAEQLLMNLNFTVKSDVSARASTTINFTKSSSPVGYDFQGTPINLQIVSGNLDIDGDGTVSLLTDSLLLKRYLVGFSGTNLISRAIGTNAVNNTSEKVSSYIQSVYDIFDIDGNGTVDMLTDNLLLDRYLADFKGDALIARAVGNNATRTTADAISSYIASLIPDQVSQACMPSLDSADFNKALSIISTDGLQNNTNSLSIDANDNASTQFQRVYSTLANTTITAGSSITLPVMYKTMDGEANLTGLGLRIHYNSNFLTYTGNSDLFTEGAVSQIVQDAADTNNNDNDSSTDRVLIMAWSNASGNWPGVAEQLLMNLNFTVKSDVSAGTSTTINFTKSSSPVGYEFQGIPVTLTTSSTNALLLDFDGNGKVNDYDIKMLYRYYVLGKTGLNMTKNIVEVNFNYSKAMEICGIMSDRLYSNQSTFDVDKNGSLNDADIKMIYKYRILGKTGLNLVKNMGYPYSSYNYSKCREIGNNIDNCLFSYCSSISSQSESIGIEEHAVEISKVDTGNEKIITEINSNLLNNTLKSDSEITTSPNMLNSLLAPSDILRKTADSSALSNDLWSSFYDENIDHQSDFEFEQALISVLENSENQKALLHMNNDMKNRQSKIDQKLGYTPISLEMLLDNDISLNW